MSKCKCKPLSIGNTGSSSGGGSGDGGLLAKAKWTPTKGTGPLGFDPLTSGGPVVTTTVTTNDTITGIGPVTTTVVANDATVRHAVFTVPSLVGITNGDAIYLGVSNQISFGAGLVGKMYILSWNAGNGNFDLLVGDPSIGTSPAAGTPQAVVAGDELAVVTDNTGAFALHINGTLVSTDNGQSTWGGADVYVFAYPAWVIPTGLQLIAGPLMLLQDLHYMLITMALSITSQLVQQVMLTS